MAVWDISQAAAFSRMNRTQKKAVPAHNTAIKQKWRIEDMFTTNYEFRNLFFLETLPKANYTAACLGTCRSKYSDTEKLLFALIDMDSSTPMIDDMLILPMDAIREAGRYRLSSLGSNAELEVVKTGNLTIRLTDEIDKNEIYADTYSLRLPATGTDPVTARI